MDLMEYQAKELFAKHGVPVLPGVVAETVDEARAAAEQLGGRSRRQGTGQDRGPRQGRRRQARRPQPTRPRRRPQAILGLDIKGHTVRECSSRKPATSTEEYYVSYLLDRANRTYLAMASVEGGMDIEQLAVERPGGTGPGPGRRAHRRRRRQGHGDRRCRAIPRRRARPGRRRPARSCGRPSPTRTRRSSRSTRW